MKKQELFDFLKIILTEKLDKNEENVKQIQESLFSETKSSAGDKHETARAMAQLELEQAGKMLREAEIQLTLLEKIGCNSCQQIMLGALIITNKEVFYINVPLGKIKFENQDIFCIGNQAPIYAQMHGKKVGESFVFLGKEYLIIQIN